MRNRPNGDYQWKEKKAARNTRILSTSHPILRERECRLKKKKKKRKNFFYFFLREAK